MVIKPKNRHFLAGFCKMSDGLEIRRMNNKQFAYLDPKHSYWELYWGFACFPFSLISYFSPRFLYSD